MKKAIGWIGAYVTFYLGHWTHLLMVTIDKEWVFDLLYPLYNQLMLWSCNINDWAGLDLWTPANTEETQ